MSKSRNALALIVFLALPLALISLFSERDSRTPVSMPAPARDAFMAEMHGQIGNLEAVLQALSTRDFGAAAEIASARIDFGHRFWQAMKETGLSGSQITALRDHMAQPAPTPSLGPEAGTGFPGSSGTNGALTSLGAAGVTLPAGFRALGTELQTAATRFAAAARAAQADPSGPHASTLTTKLDEVSTICRSCHESYRIEFQE